MKLKLSYLLSLILILIIFANCNDSGIGVNQKYETKKVTLIAPKAGSEQSTSFTFQWRPIKTVGKYRFQLSGSKDFSSIIINSVVDSIGLKIQGLPYDSTLYWKVRPIAEGSEAVWSDVWKFRTTKEAILPAPEQLSPKNEAREISLKPTFKWKKVEGADAYLLHVSQSQKLIIEKEISSTSFTPDDKLKSNEDVYWQIRAINDSTKGDWSDIESFTTKPITPPVVLATPAEGAKVSTTSVLLKWKGLPGINNYKVQVAWKDYFPSPVVNKTVGKTSYQPSGLDKGRTYYWRVQAVNDGNTENWSSVYSFTINVPNSASSDRVALMDLYKATDGDHWTHNSGWGSDSPLGTWYGIDTDANGRVTRIDLYHNNLTGEIKDIPWGNLTKVKYLNIKYNHLTGSLPASLGSMAGLQVLILQGRNYKIGGVGQKEPPALHTGRWFYNYHQGKYYSNTNEFSGKIPAELGNLSNLIVLELSNAQKIIGPIPPELGNLSNLKGLYLTGANFGGYTIPSSLCKLTQLRHLYLGESGLTGDIPDCFENLTKLTALMIPGKIKKGANKIPHGSLTGNISFITHMPDLRNLSFIGNELTGQIARYINKANFIYINILNLAGNNFTGPLPDISRFPNLYGFDVARNKLTGSIDALLGAPRKIKIISVGWNNLSGEFPQSGWPDFFQLKTLTIGANHISGEIPCSFWKKIDNPRLNWVRLGEMPDIDDACRSGGKAMKGDGSIDLTMPSPNK